MEKGGLNGNMESQQEGSEENDAANDLSNSMDEKADNSHTTTDDEGDTYDDDGEDFEDENCLSEKDDKFAEQSDSLKLSKGSERGKKRRRKSPNRRKNIRKVLKMHQLDPKTLEAQKEEQERLHRLELQRTLSDQNATISAPPQTDDMNDDLVVSNQPILIVDDDGDESDSMDDEHSSCNEVNFCVPTRPSPTGSVILISSSDSEEEAMFYDDDRVSSDSSEDYSNLISAASVKNDSADIIVNTGHMADEPDIFLPPQIAKVVKPHQILGIRFLYDNLIESIKELKSNHGLGCILAHAMGLGKTIQTISLIHIFLRCTHAKNVLVLVPINTLQNWLCEFNMWVPAKLVDGSNSKELEPESVVKDSRAVVESLEENRGTEAINQEQKNSSDKPDDDNLTKISSNATSAADNVEKHDNQVLSEEMPGTSSVSENSAKEKVEIEHRDYDVFIINDSHKTTASRASVVDQWHTKGGVLLMGYEMFRMISLYKASLCNSVTNAKGKKRKKAKTNATFIDIDEEEKEMKLMLDMQKAMCDPGPDLVVCDEGHRIKNHQSNIHHALHKIRTRKRLVLTGYPLQNNLTEYWCMVDFVRPNYLGSRQEFQNMFERPIVNGQCIDSTAEDKKLMKYRAHVLSSLLKGFVQRRDYTALKVALPPKEEHIIMVRMSKIQEAIYRRFLLLMQEGYGDQLNPIKIFAVCSKIWNHPDILYRSMIDQSKKTVIFDTDVDMIIEDGLRSKSSSKQFQNELGLNQLANDAKTLLSKITDWAKEIFDSHNYTEGVIENSGKLVILMELIKESLSQGDKMLVFSQSLLTLDLIEEVLNRTPVFPDTMENTEDSTERKQWRKNTDYFRIDGNTSSSERERLIELFNRKDNESAKLFLLSTRAGCLGINLVGANRVVVFDVSWNPCHDAQAVCRVYRYGQQKPCFIYRLIASNTMEKRMYYRQISKQGVSDRVVDEMNPVENFSKDELTKLLSTSWEDEPHFDFEESTEVINDPVLQTLCTKCSPWIVNLPFQHESLLLDQASSKLSNREKREAKKDYEEEKRRAVLGINGPFPSRGSPYSQMSNFPMAEIPGNELPNQPSSSVQDQLQQSRILSGHQTVVPGMRSNNAALVNILRHIQQLGTEDSFAAHSRLLNTLSTDTQMQNVLYHLNLLNSASARLLNSTNARLLNSCKATLPSLTTVSQTSSNMDVSAASTSTEGIQRPFASTATQQNDNRSACLPVSEASLSNMRDNLEISPGHNNEQPCQSFDSKISNVCSNGNNEQSTSTDNKEVICIESDGENE